MKHLLLLGALMWTSSSFAALSGYWDSVSQISFIMHADEVSEVVFGSIKEITKTDDPNGMTYKVRTEDCFATVSIKSINGNRPGPLQYQIDQVSNVSCRNR